MQVNPALPWPAQVGFEGVITLREPLTPNQMIAGALQLGYSYHGEAEYSSLAYYDADNILIFMVNNNIWATDLEPSRLEQPVSEIRIMCNSVNNNDYGIDYARLQDI